jgi:hypothetical protein
MVRVGVGNDEKIDVKRVSGLSEQVGKLLRYGPFDSIRRLIISGMRSVDQDRRPTEVAKNAISIRRLPYIEEMNLDAVLNRIGSYSQLWHSNLPDNRKLESIRAHFLS